MPNGLVHMLANHEIHGLLQSGLLVNLLLENGSIRENSVLSDEMRTILRKNELRPLQFALVVDNFGVK